MSNNHYKSSQMKHVNTSGKPVLRRRSSSLDPEKIAKHRLHKYRSSGDIYADSYKVESNKNINDSSHKRNYSLYVTSCMNISDSEANKCNNIFCAWMTDFRMIKSQLCQIANHTETLDVRKLSKQYFIFFIMPVIKIDAEYEIYVLPKYDVKESVECNGNQTCQVLGSGPFNYGIQMSPCKEHAREIDEEENTLESGIQRRNSESMAFVAYPKNQNLSSITHFDGETTICKIDVDLVSCFTKPGSNNEFKGQGEIILTTYRICILHKKRLKHHIFLKHFSCSLCPNPTITNSNSCIRIIPLLHDELFVRFKSPVECTAFHKEIDEAKSNISPDLGKPILDTNIFDETGPKCQTPLVGKKFPITQETKIKDLKEVALKEFGVTENVNLFVKTNQKNKQLQVNDNINVLRLAEHIWHNNFSTDCTEHCHRSNHTLTIRLFMKSTESQKQKKSDKKPTEFVYNLNIRWIKEDLPNWLLNLMADLYQNCLLEGIFRKPGLASEIESVIQSIKLSDDFTIDCKTLSKAGILKKFLWFIDNTILNLETTADFDKICGLVIDYEQFMSNNDLQHQFLQFIKSLPPRNHLLLCHILILLKKITDNYSITLMNSKDLGICFGQSMFRKYTVVLPVEDYKKANTIVEDCQKPNNIIQILIEMTPNIIDDPVTTRILNEYSKRGFDSVTALNEPMQINGKETGDVAITISTEEVPVAPPRKYKSDKTESQSPTVSVGEKDVTDGDTSDKPFDRKAKNRIICRPPNKQGDADASSDTFSHNTNHYNPMIKQKSLDLDDIEVKRNSLCASSSLDTPEVSACGSDSNSTNDVNNDKVKQTIRRFENNYSPTNLTSNTNTDSGSSSSPTLSGKRGVKELISKFDKHIQDNSGNNSNDFNNNNNIQSLSSVSQTHRHQSNKISSKECKKLKEAIENENEMTYI